MAKKYNNQIKAGSGFTIAGEYPIDDREVAQSYSDLATFVSSKIAYEGMRVYVVGDKKSYEYVSYIDNGVTSYKWKEISRIKILPSVPEPSTPGDIGDIIIVYNPDS